MIDHQLRLASTVILLRDTEQGLETLLLRRNAKLAFAAGAWVFPGGAIDQVEIETADSQMEAAKIAAVREAKEECGVDLAAEDLAHFCNWTTPEGESRRFATWFFVVEIAYSTLVSNSSIFSAGLRSNLMVSSSSTSSTSQRASVMCFPKIIYDLLNLYYHIPISWSIVFLSNSQDFL